ncbi:hypothetical protein B7R21_13680 [Subtercola boreus]|uniref:DUF4439 domain-containing protein n=1 Tax=Subtercola boreus TaxID=120213 RepID=A0A3E0VC52_9MICO|nr:hypothetical protein [Subtercola boreus]RFA07269.1 hypothetical protein B7R21_13680 [Subtercola boreus]
MVRLSRAALVACVVALAFGFAGCTSAKPSPTGIQSPTTSPSASPGPSAGAMSEWGAYGTKDDACSAVAGDVLTLALAPKNLALADPGSGVDDIDDTIRTAAEAAPPAIAPNYTQLSAIVRTFGQALAEWDAAVKTEASSSSASATATPGSSGPTSAPTPSQTAAGVPERPEFVATAFTAQLDRIKVWLSDTCG